MFSRLMERTIRADDCPAAMVTLSTLYMDAGSTSVWASYLALNSFTNVLTPSGVERTQVTSFVTGTGFPEASRLTISKV